jgi:uncharacterized protein (DUF111 family)
LPRSEYTVETPLGKIVGKLAQLPDGSSRFSPEYEAAKQIADSQDISLRDVYAAAQVAYRSVQG